MRAVFFVMKLIRTDGNPANQDPILPTRPVPREILDGIRAKINSPEEDRRIMEMVRRNMADAAILGPMPVGGEDEYERARKRD